MNSRIFLAALLPVAIAGCATMPASGAPASGARTSTLARTAAFDHGCAEERVRVIRADGALVAQTSTVDLDVCGAVRRYKVFRAFDANSTFQTWVDVTSLYPPSALPAPLPSNG